MLPTSRAFASVLTAPLLAASACTAAPAPTSSATAAPAITASAVPVPTTRSASPSASATATDDAACPAGDYTVTSFRAAGLTKAMADGTGGEIGVEFTNGRYEVDFDDDQPITLKTSTGTTRLTVNGDIAGTYAGPADNLTFSVTKSTGTARARVGGTTSSVTMAKVADVLGLKGTGSAVCSGNRLTLKVRTSTFNLVQDD